MNRGPTVGERWGVDFLMDYVYESLELIGASFLLVAVLRLVRRPAAEDESEQVADGA